MGAVEGSRLTEKVRIKKGAGLIGGGDRGIAKLDIKVEAEGAGAGAEG